VDNENLIGTPQVFHRFPYTFLLLSYEGAAHWPECNASAAFAPRTARRLHSARLIRQRLVAQAAIAPGQRSSKRIGTE
jgi:hypothetical protein